MFFCVLIGVLIPFLGTTLGASCVYFFNKGITPVLNKILIGFAGGVMVAASIWSLIIPSIDYSKDLGVFSFFPATVGLWLGVIFIIALDKFVPCNQIGDNKQKLFFWAVLIHNIPEGMAVGVVYAGLLTGNTEISLYGALVLSIGIAVQNFPEGAIISLPLLTEGYSKNKSMLLGIVSGVVEPLGAVLALVAVTVVSPVLPYVLGFAAGTMIYVVLEELLPELKKNGKFSAGNLSFVVGFSVMMILDVVLG